MEFDFSTHQWSRTTHAANIFFVIIAIVFVSSWLFVWIFLSFKELMQLSSIAIFSFIVAVSIIFAINAIGFIYAGSEDSVLSGPAYHITCIAIFILYNIGHLIVILLYVDKIRLSMQEYQPRKYERIHRILIHATTFLSYAMFVVFCVALMVPAFRYRTVIFTLWLILELMIASNVVYLYILQLTCLYAQVRHKKSTDGGDNGGGGGGDHLYGTVATTEAEPQTSASSTADIDMDDNMTTCTITDHDVLELKRMAWNITCTLLWSLTCMLCIVGVHPSFYNLSHALLSLNMCIHILCILSFHDYLPWWVDKVCLVGDAYCVCRRCRCRYQCRCCSICLLLRQQRSHLPPSTELRAGGGATSATSPVFDTDIFGVAPSIVRTRTNDEDDDDAKAIELANVPSLSVASQYTQVSITSNAASAVSKPRPPLPAYPPPRLPAYLSAPPRGPHARPRPQPQHRQRNTQVQTIGDMRSRPQPTNKTSHLESTSSVSSTSASASASASAWRPLDASAFDVRHKDYFSANGSKRRGAKKIPSAPALYDVFAMDAYRIDERLTFMQFIGKHGMHTSIDVSKLMMETVEVDSEVEYLPNLLVVHLVLPLQSSSNASPATDTHSAGICATFYAKLSQHTLDILHAFRSGSLVQLPESIELFAKLTQQMYGADGIQRRQCQSQSQSRTIENAMKCTLRINNLSQVSLPFMLKKMMKKANGQSMVVKHGERASYFMHPSRQFFVIDIDGFNISKQAHSMWNHAKTALDSIICDVALFLSGQCQPELPEQILLCAQIHKLCLDDIPAIHHIH